MKKFLGILVLVLLWCGNVNAVEILVDTKTVNDYVKSYQNIYFINCCSFSF